MALELKGEENGDYVTALDFVRRKSREEGVDAALGAGGRILDGLLKFPFTREVGLLTKAGFCTLLNLLASQSHKCTLADVDDSGYPMISIHRSAGSILSRPLLLVCSQAQFLRATPERR